MVRSECNFWKRNNNKHHQYKNFHCTCTGSNRQPGIKSVTVNKTVSCSMILIYMSSGSYTGALGGRNGADAKCDLGEMLGCQVHKAFLSVNNEDYIAHFTRVGVLSRLPIYWYSSQSGNITPLANNWADLLGGPIMNSQLIGTGVNEWPWTGSTVAGQVDPNSTCLGWTTAANNRWGMSGSPADRFSGWLAGWGRNCSLQGPIRCLCQK